MKHIFRRNIEKEERKGYCFKTPFTLNSITKTEYKQKQIFWVGFLFSLCSAINKLAKRFADFEIKIFAFVYTKWENARYFNFIA